jgi:hypothetical protein
MRIGSYLSGNKEEQRKWGIFIVIEIVAVIIVILSFVWRLIK